MDIDMMENQELAAIKRLWDKHGNKIAVIIFLSVLTVFGWRYWQHYKTEQAEHAAIIYDNLLEAASQGDVQATTRAFNELARRYGSTPYVRWASLIVAKQAVDDNNLKDADLTLQTLAMHAGNTPQGTIARIRLARVRLAQHQAESALRVLAEITDKTYLPLAAQIKGDAFMQLKKFAEARSAYDTALAGLPANSANYQIVQMQRNQLGTP